MASGLNKTPFPSPKSALVKGDGERKAEASPSSSTAAEVFQQALEQPTASSSAIGNLRFERFQKTLKTLTMSNPLTEEDELLLKEVLSEFQNQTLDNPFLILALSINRDLNHAATKDPLNATKVGAMQKIFRSSCLSFIDDSRSQTPLFLTVLKLVPFEESLQTDFDSKTGKTFQLLNMIAPGSLNNANKKWYLWSKLLKLPQYMELATTPLSIETTEPEEALRAEKMSASPSIHKIDQISQELYLSEEKMVEFLIEYLDFIGDQYPEYTDLFTSVGSNLYSITQALKEEDSQKAQKLRRHTIGLLQEKLTELQSYTESFSDPTKLALLIREQEKKRIEEVKGLAKAMEAEFTLTRFLVSLDTLIENQRRLLVGERFYYNLHACPTISDNWEPVFDGLPETIKDEMQIDFEGVCREMDTFDPLRGIIEFDPLETPEKLQQECIQLKTSRRKKIPYAPRFLPFFERLHHKYSEFASQLVAKGQPDTAQRIVEAYQELCLSTAPLFFCIKDLRNMRTPQLDDSEPAIIPDKILELFDLEVEEGLLNTDLTPPTSQDLQPQQQEPLAQDLQAVPESPLGKSLATQLKGTVEEKPLAKSSAASTSKAVPLEVPYKSKHIEQARSPSVKSKGSSSSSSPERERSPSPEPFRFRRGMKKRNLKKLIRSMFEQNEGSRHTRFGNATVLSRSGKKNTIPIGTLKAMEAQLNHGAAGFGGS